jgi:hypothetical protein
MKRLVTYLLIFIVSAFLVYTGQTRFFTLNAPFVEFLTASYFFFVSFSIILCFGLHFLQKKKQFEQRLGFLYLFSVGFKIILFAAFFKTQIFNERFDSNKELLNILIIIGLTLVFEVIFVAKLLNNSDHIKNVE